MATGTRGLVIAVNLAYAVILLLLGVSADIPAIGRGISGDVAHAAATAVQTLLIFALLRAQATRATAAILAAVGATLYGGFIEMLQLLQPARAVEAADLVANALGACSMALFISVAMRATTRGTDR